MRDAGRTQIAPGSMTVLAVGPGWWRANSFSFTIFVLITQVHVLAFQDQQVM